MNCFDLKGDTLDRDNLLAVQHLLYHGILGCQNWALKHAQQQTASTCGLSHEKQRKENEIQEEEFEKHLKSNRSTVKT